MPLIFRKPRGCACTIPFGWIRRPRRTRTFGKSGTTLCGNGSRSSTFVCAGSLDSHTRSRYTHVGHVAHQTCLLSPLLKDRPRSWPHLGKPIRPPSGPSLTGRQRGPRSWRVRCAESLADQAHQRLRPVPAVSRSYPRPTPHPAPAWRADPAQIQALLGHASLETAGRRDRRYRGTGLRLEATKPALTRELTPK